MCGPYGLATIFSFLSRQIVLLANRLYLSLCIFNVYIFNFYYFLFWILDFYRDFFKFKIIIFFYIILIALTFK